MSIDWMMIAIAAPAVVFAGVSKGGFGSGPAFVSAAILAVVLEPGQAIGIMLPLLMIMDVAALRPYWKKWHGADSKLLILGALPGVVAGGWLYQSVDADVFRILIGVISLAFVVWQVGVRPRLVAGKTHIPPWGGMLAGAIAGFTSFVSHAGGPPAAVYLLSRDRSKTEYQATTVIVFWAINVMKAVPYGFLGIFTAQTLIADAVLIPFALLGTWIGVKLHYRISEGAFFKLTYVLLVCTGLKLIWDGIM